MAKKTKKNIAKGKAKKKRQARAAAEAAQRAELTADAQQELTAAQKKEMEKAEKAKAKEAAERKKKKERKENPTFWDKTVAYFKSTWAELKKTQWLDASQLNKATGSVFGIVSVFTVITWIVDSGLGALTALILGI